MIRIITDTTCALPQNFLRDKCIDLIPQLVVVDDIAYQDEFEIDVDSFLSKLKVSSQFPKTAAPPPSCYRPLFEKYAQNGDSVLVITPSSEVSGTFRNASSAAQEFIGADIHIVDVHTLAGGLGSLVLQAEQWILEGLQIQQIVLALNEMAKKERVYFIVDSLDFLHRGGRIGGAFALVGSLLQIKPILTAKDGKIAQFEKQRTMKRAIHRIVQLTLQHSVNNHDPHITICHIAAEESALEIRKNLLFSLNLPDIPILKLSPSIAVHAGPGTIAVSCFCQ